MYAETEVVNTETDTVKTFVQEAVDTETGTVKTFVKKAEGPEPDVWGFIDKGEPSSSSVVKIQDISKSNYQSTMGMDQ